MALPTSWNEDDKGSKSRMRWIALSCLSSLVNTSDLNNLIRPVKLMRLWLGVTYLLFAKTSKKQKDN